MNKDLTVGKPTTVLWRFCLPLFGSMVFQQLYNIADSLIAGKYIGENALAAVGNSYEITLIYLAFAFGCNMGCSVITAQLFGAKDIKNMKTAVYTAILSSAALCAVLMLFGLLLGSPLLDLIRTPAEILADSKLYLNIYTLGLPFLFFYNISTGIFSALGDSRTPFLFLAFSSTANIGVDILFVKQFQMGVAGVAWATFLCQGVSCVLALTVVLRRLKAIPCEGPVPLFRPALLKKLLRIALPSIAQQGGISVGNLILQSVINGFGPGVIAGYAAGVKLNNLVITSFTTLGNGVSNYTAQNLGAGKYDRIRAGLKAGTSLVWVISAPIFVLYFFFGSTLLHLFLDDPTADALSTGVAYLRILSPFYFMISMKLVIDGILRGCGMMKEFMADTLSDLTLRVVFAVLLSRTALGSLGVWCAWPIGWTLAFGLSVHFYRHASWNRKRSAEAAAR